MAELNFGDGGHGHGHAGGELVLSFLGEMCSADPAFASLLLQLLDGSKRSLGGSSRKEQEKDGGDDGIACAGDERVLAVRIATRDIYNKRRYL